MSALSPGLYRAEVRGIPDTIVLVDDSGYGHHHTILGVSRHSGPSQITDARPLIEAAGYRLMRAEAAIERVKALMDDWSIHDAESFCRCCGGYSRIRDAIAGES